MQLVAEQQAEARERAAAARPAPGAGGGRSAPGAAFPCRDIPFDDAGGTNPRNNSSAITMVTADGHHMLFTADGGVPALERAWDWLELNVGGVRLPDFIDLPHHGSRHNASSRSSIASWDRPVNRRSTFVNVGPGAKKHPSPRVANAFMRRGHRVYQTSGQTIYHFSAEAAATVTRRWKYRHLRPGLLLSTQSRSRAAAPSVSSRRVRGRRRHEPRRHRQDDRSDPPTGRIVNAGAIYSWDSPVGGVGHVAITSTALLRVNSCVKPG